MKVYSQPKLTQLMNIYLEKKLKKNSDQIACLQNEQYENYLNDLFHLLVILLTLKERLVDHEYSHLIIHNAIIILRFFNA